MNLVFVLPMVTCSIVAIICENKGILAPRLYFALGWVGMAGMWFLSMVLP